MNSPKDLEHEAGTQAESSQLQHEETEHQNVDNEYHNEENEYNQETEYQNEENEYHNQETEYHNEENEYHNEENEYHNQETEFQNEETEFQNEETEYQDEDDEYHNEETEYQNEETEHQNDEDTLPMHPKKLPDVHVMHHQLEFLRKGMLYMQELLNDFNNYSDCTNHNFKSLEKNEPSPILPNMEFKHLWLLHCQIFNNICCGKCTDEQMTQMRLDFNDTNLIFRVTTLQQRLQVLNIIANKRELDLETWLEGFEKRCILDTDFQSMDTPKLEIEKIYHAFVADIIKQKQLFDIDIKFSLIEISHLIKICCHLYLMQLLRFLNYEQFFG